MCNFTPFHAIKTIQEVGDLLGGEQMQNFSTVYLKLNQLGKKTQGHGV